ncbi:MAG: hypothetical protein ABI130_12870, partial [Leifsonia sp.]
MSALVVAGITNLFDARSTITVSWSDPATRVPVATRSLQFNVDAGAESAGIYELTVAHDATRRAAQYL